MLNLLLKDFKLMFGQEKSPLSRVLSILFTLLFVALFVTVEVFLFKTILDKIVTVQNAPRAFLTLFLTVTSLLLVIANTFQAKKLFFDAKDIEQLSTHPVANRQIILSKLVFLLVSHCITSTIFQFPLFIAYGITVGKMAVFYYTAIFFPLASFLFIGGISLLLVYPLWLLTSFLKKHFILQFITSIIAIVLMTLAYSYVLDIFINLVANNDLLTLFSDQSIGKFMVFEKYAVPINFMVDIFVNKAYSPVVPFLTISLGVFALGLGVSIYAFHTVRNLSIAETPLTKEKIFKATSPLKALIKKEFILIAKNSDYIYSFTGLLLVQPLLLQLVVKSINAVLGAGTIMYYTALVPGLITFVDVLIVMLFSVVINQGANSYIGMEASTIKVLKTIPVPYKLQLAVKVAIPYLFSIVSLLFSTIVLIATNTMDWSYCLLTFLLTAIFIFIFDMISLQEELKIRQNKERSSFLSGVFAYLLPIMFTVTAIILSYFKINGYLSFLGGFAVFILIGVFPVVYTFNNAGRLFMELEAKN